MNNEFKSLDYRTGHLDGIKEGFKMAMEIADQAARTYMKDFHARGTQHQMEMEECQRNAILFVCNRLKEWWGI